MTAGTIAKAARRAHTRRLEPRRIEPAGAEPVVARQPDEQLVAARATPNPGEAVGEDGNLVSDAFVLDVPADLDGNWR
jgi:hypothetical protein